MTLRRREFITALGGAAAWTLAAHAQQRERMRRIGVFLNLPSDDPEGQARVGAFLQGLQEAGWSLGRNVRIDYRWGAGIDDDRTRKYAEELVALAPDVIVAGGAGTTNAEGNPDGADRVRQRSRPSRRRLGREFATTRRQRHRFHKRRI
jgi:putative ABC transport system substrate-binding protein